MIQNPCQKCGACCAHFRVSFYWAEADPKTEGSVPLEMTEKLDDFRRCMIGTDQPKPRCAALSGIIGEAVNCTIYENRPSPCREFGIDWLPEGFVVIPNDLERCTQARAAWGLPPVFDDPTNVPPLSTQDDFNHKVS